MPDFSDRDDATTRPKAWRQQHSDTSQERNQRIRTLPEQGKDAIFDAPPNLSRAVSSSKPGTRRSSGCLHTQMQGTHTGGASARPKSAVKMMPIYFPMQDSMHLVYILSLSPHVSKHKKTPAGLVLVGVSSGGASGA